MKKNGFTLLEVLVAIAILAIALTALFGSQHRSMSAAARADFAVTSTILAQNLMDQAIAGGAEPGERFGDFGSAHPGYRYHISTIDPDFTEIRLLSGIVGMVRQVTVTISSDGGKQLFELERFVIPGAGD